MMLVVEFAGTSNEAAALLETKLGEFLRDGRPAGLLSFRVCRHTEHSTRVLMIEEWTDDVTQATFAARPQFHEFLASIGPLMTVPPNGDSYSIVASGPIPQA